MAKKIITVAILGAGSRGLDSYSKFMKESGLYKIVAACDKRQIKLDQAKKEQNIKDENLFLDEKEFFKKKLADLLVVATQDQDHVRHCIAGMKIGYDVLLEKPITPSKAECLKLLEAQKKYKKKVVVCHVLRYAPAYLAVSKLIDDGAIGKLVDIHALEQVTFWHQAHSFVRGNWRNSKTTSPMILAKCCHDMDLLQYFAKSKCKVISSMGNLSFFNKANMPKGASKRCKDCKYIDTCPYSAKYVYVTRWKEAGKPATMWPQNVVCNKFPLTEKGIMKAYESNDYGRCVFACDNNVVDHQETIVTFENGVTANLCMTAFAQKNGRIYKFHGTYGEIQLDEERGEIFIRKYGEKEKIVPFNELPDVTGGHGGGDAALVKALYKALTSKGKMKTNLETSIESHLMCFAAEESRLNNGKAIFLHK